MPKELPVVVVTVRFSRRRRKQPTGIQLAALMQYAIGQNHGVSYIELTSYHDGYVKTFGQTSDQPGQHMLVSPSLDGPAIFVPGKRYREVKIMNYSWGGSANTYARQTLINVVRKVARELAEAYEDALINGFPSYIEPDNDL